MPFITGLKVVRSDVYLTKMSEPPWRHYARGMLPLSPIAKKSREGNYWPNKGDFSELKKDGDGEKNKKEKRKRGIVVNVKPHINIMQQENSPQTQNSRNAMLRRLADCFAHRQMTAKSRAKRHRVLGFHPRLCTIHENASELANDLDATFNSLTADGDLREFNTKTPSPTTKADNTLSTLERCPSFTSCCQTNDQTIAALHEDIKELWMRLETVEKDFAWARGSLLTISNKDETNKR